MTKNSRENQIDNERQLSPEEKDVNKDTALVSGLERLAFKLHDFANRLLGYLR